VPLSFYISHGSSTQCSSILFQRPKRRSLNRLKVVAARVRRRMARRKRAENLLVSKEKPVSAFITNQYPRNVIWSRYCYFVIGGDYSG